MVRHTRHYTRHHRSHCRPARTSVRFIDTAGLRQTDDTIENLGIRRAITAPAKIALRVLANRPYGRHRPADEAIAHTYGISACRPHINTNQQIRHRPRCRHRPPQCHSKLPALHKKTSSLVSAAEGTGTEKAIETIANKTTSGYDPMRETVIANAKQSACLEWGEKEPSFSIPSYPSIWAEYSALNC